MQDALKHELHDVISGKSEVRFGAVIQAVASYLGNGPSASPGVEEAKQVREQEAQRLEQFISNKLLWKNDIDFSQYVSEGAEQRVYLNAPDRVIKLNDAIYYRTWKDYFENLIIHNYFFPDTAYELLGFTKENGVLYAVVQQAYVIATEDTDLDKVAVFLATNGFKRVRNNDYFNPEIGLILEDLHDENVLTNDGVLYFIDTVFFTTEAFWE